MKNRHLITGILAVIIIAPATGVQSQTLPLRIYSIEEGLSESNVHDLLQDRDGYIWIGTGYGLNRFDGIRMHSYYQNDGLNNNFIHDLAEDDSGSLWIGTGEGINIIDEGAIYSPSYLDDLLPYSVTALYQDVQGDWWFGTDGAGVWLLDSNNQLTQYTTVHGLAGNQVQDIIQIADRSIWFATSGGLTSLDTGNFSNFTKASGLPDDDVRVLNMDDAGRLWIGTDQGFAIMDGDSISTYDMNRGLTHNSVLTISISDDGTAWIGTEEGVSRFDDNLFTNYTMEQGLPSNIIYSTLIDREGHPWFGTMGGGAAVFLGDYFHNYTADEGLTNNVVTGFDVDPEGNFWISTFGGGIMRYDGTESVFFNESNGLIDNRVFTVYSDPDGTIWAGTRNGISIIENGVIHEPPEPYSDLTMVRSFFQDKETGYFWIGTDNEGVYRFNEDTVVNYDDTNYLDSNSVMSVQKDREGRIWLATYGGVVIIESGEFSKFTIEDGLPANGVTHILLDHAGKAWISTINGVARLDTETVEIERFTSLPGSSSSMAYFMFQDHRNHFWIGTNTGLIRFDYERYRTAESDIDRILSYRLINQEQGLITNEMNAGAYHKDSAGTVWLGTIEGISRFFPDRLPERRSPPVVHFEEIRVSGEMVPSDKRMVISHDRNFIQFDFTGISFSAPSQVLFEYRLSGVDDDWTRSFSRSVRYPSLSPGNYTFQLRAYNSSGVQSERVRSFEFEIYPPMWLQWWFFTFAGFVVIAVILFVFNYYRVRRLVEMERMRVQIASDLHDDVGASLTELALQTDFLRTGTLEESVEMTLKQIGEQSRRIVSTLDDIVWSIDSRNDSAGDLTDRMQDHANRILASKGVELHYDLAELDTSQQLPVQVKENLYLIFKESVNNIAKHSNADVVMISLSLVGKKYVLDISDNGTVRTNGRKTGQGLSNINMRAKRMNANAIIDREKGFNIRVEGTFD